MDPPRPRVTRQVIGFLHRNVWQRLPHAQRRRAFEQVVAWLAPRASRRPDPGGPVTTVGVFQAASGLGQSARLCQKAIRALGQSASVWDVSQALMASGAEAPNPDEVGLEPGPGILIVHVNAPILPRALLALGRKRVEGKVIVGYWHWELPLAPASWKRGIACVHEVWTPSRFVADAIRPLAGDKPVRVVPHPVKLDLPVAPKTPAGTSSEPFKVLVAFDLASSFARKNPLGAIAAFRQAFGDDPGARLILRVLRRDAYPKGWDDIVAATGGAANIEMIEKASSRREMLELIRGVDVALSLHRSEGFGLVPAEAMLLGTNVVATNWSGNVDFLNAGNGMPVDYVLRPADDPQGEYHHPSLRWADADVGQAAAALRRLRADPELRARLAEAALADAARLFGPDGYEQALEACRRAFSSTASRPAA